MDAVRTGYPHELGAEDPFALTPPVTPECPLCSGKVSRDDPAAQALAWGVRVAEAKEGASDFWKGAVAVDFLRWSVPSLDTGVSEWATELAKRQATGEQEEWARKSEDCSLGIVGVDVAREDSLTSSGPPLEEVSLSASGWDSLLNPSGRRVAKYRHLLEDARRFQRLPRTGAGSGENVCCVEEFRYYESIWRVVDADLIKGYKVGFEFAFGAVYTEDPPCRCDCCWFVQYVSASTLRWPLAVPGVSVGPVVEQYTEDCVVIRDGEVIGSTVTGTAPREGDVMDCYPGMHDALRISRTPPAGVPIGSIRGDGWCWWRDWDEPHVRWSHSSLHQYFDFTWNFLGVIYDICVFPPRIEDIRPFTVKLSGLSFAFPFSFVVLENATVHGKPLP